MKSNDERSSHFLLGMGIGAVLGILLAPRSGKETRKKLGQDAEEYYERGQKLFGEAKEHVEDIRTDLEPKVHAFLEKVVPVIEEAKDVSKPYKDELMEQIRDLAEETEYKGHVGMKKAKKAFRNIKRQLS